MLRASDFFDLDQLEHAALFEGTEYVWEALGRLSGYLESLFTGTSREIHGQVSAKAELCGERIYIGHGAVVEGGATIHAPAWIGDKCQVRQGAYLRGNVLASRGSVLGHASELKNAILLPGAKAPHFAYVGDSILGSKSNIGAGTKLSNLTVVSVKDKASGKRPSIKLLIEGKEYDTGMAKLGAIVGDGAQTGCNTVTNPGLPHRPAHPDLFQCIAAQGPGPGRLHRQAAPDPRDRGQALSPVFSLGSGSGAQNPYGIPRECRPALSIVPAGPARRDGRLVPLPIQSASNLSIGTQPPKERPRTRCLAPGLPAPGLPPRASS